MREAKPEWLAQLRALEGCAEAEIRWNQTVGRWEFILVGADGKPRSQFWGQFYDDRGRPTKPDPVTGLYPFRDLDDTGMREAIANLEKTFIANRYDGAGTTRREVLRRYRFNRELMTKKFKEAGWAFADMAAERGHRLRGSPIIHVPVHIGKRQPEQGATT